ncbi:MAG: MFS transporter [Terriglobales bacterium]
MRLPTTLPPCFATGEVLVNRFQGALARIPMGMLADRFGGRVMFSLLMLGVAAPVFLVPAAGSYPALLTVAFFLGMAGCSFAVGAAYVSRWTSPERQGSALGIYGLGNVGQSVAVFLGPVLAAVLGTRLVFRGMALVLVAWGIVYLLLPRNAPGAARPKTIGDRVAVLTRSHLSWVLAAFWRGQRTEPSAW